MSYWSVGWNEEMLGAIFTWCWMSTALFEGVSKWPCVCLSIALSLSLSLTFSLFFVKCWPDQGEYCCRCQQGNVPQLKKVFWLIIFLNLSHCHINSIGNNWNNFALIWSKSVNFEILWTGDMIAPWNGGESLPQASGLCPSAPEQWAPFGLLSILPPQY